MGDALISQLKDIPQNIMSTLTKEFTKVNIMNENEKSAVVTMQFAI